MKSVILGSTVGLAALCAGTTVNAQAPSDAAGNSAPGGMIAVSGGVEVGNRLAPAQGQGQVFPYSYYVTSPSRVYVPYGSTDQFPFQGQPYGRAYDRWSWSSMTRGNGSLARYYYPPLR